MKTQLVLKKKVSQKETWVYDSKTPHVVTVLWLDSDDGDYPLT